MGFACDRYYTHQNRTSKRGQGQWDIFFENTVRNSDGKCVCIDHFAIDSVFFDKDHKSSCQSSIVVHKDISNNLHGYELDCE